MTIETMREPFRGSVARQMGLVTMGQLRGPMFRRLFQDVYVQSDVEVTHELRCRGAALIVPPEAVLTGRSAATVRGVPLAKPLDPVEFVVQEKHRFGPKRGIFVRRTEVTTQETHPWNGVRIARNPRIALDLLLLHSPRIRGWVRKLRIGVPDLDMFLRSGLVNKADLRRAIRRRPTWGIVFARLAIEMADERAESAPESELRVILDYAGFAPSIQHEVRHRGRFVARLDMCVAWAELAVEYDGKWHDKPEQQALDRKRRKKLAELGWRSMIIKAQDLAGPWQNIVAQVKAALAETPDNIPPAKATWAHGRCT